MHRQLVPALVFTAGLLSVSSGYVLNKRDSNTGIDKPYRCLWHTADRTIHSKAYEDEDQLTRKECEVNLTHTDVRTISCPVSRSENAFIREKCYCGHNVTVTQEICSSRFFRFNCSKCKTDDSCLNFGTNPSCTNGKLICSCDVPTGFQEYHGNKSPYRGLRCGNVTEHRLCHRFDDPPSDLPRCPEATSTDDNCTLKIGKTDFLCSNAVKDITEIAESNRQHCEDIVQQGEDRLDDEKPRCPAGEGVYRVSNFTEWGKMPFQNGHLKTRIRLMCRSEMPIEEMEENEIEDNCYIMKIYVRYCDSNGRCGRRLGGLRKVFEYLEP